MPSQSPASLSWLVIRKPLWRCSRRGEPSEARGRRSRTSRHRSTTRCGPSCVPGTVSPPIDVVTGRVFTHAIPICALPGPLQFVWERSYSSAIADRDAGFG
ncbi:DUF6531 domain-containing protein [Sorangium sp. So ce1182]|uniref:DUF6531 domain-containing protein n=1 Tax=Sorangium sp. So ce1182 TaxID=3133334 RepID=UPI003F5E1235